MNPLTREWVEKAEGDFATANRELRARKAPNYDAACFHAQQCAEKYLKAFLQEEGIPYGKTHNLIGLLETFEVRDSSWEGLRPDLEALTVYAVIFRYPGETADRTTARKALEHGRKVRAKVRENLGFSD